MRRADDSIAPAPTPSSAAAPLPSTPTPADDRAAVLVDVWRDLRRAGWAFVALLVVGFATSFVLLVVVVQHGVADARARDAARAAPPPAVAACDPLVWPFAPTATWGACAELRTPR